MACNLDVNYTAGKHYAYRIIYYRDGRPTAKFYKTTSYKKTQRCNNPKVSRPKPKNLILSQTAMPTQWSLDRELGMVLEATDYPTGAVSRIETYIPITSVAKQHGPYPTNWELDMRLKIKDLSINLGTNLVEYRETSNMFHRSAINARNAWRHWKGLKRSRRKLNPCDVAAAELTAAYGITPLAQTVAYSTLRLQKRLDKDILRRFVVTKRKTFKGSVDNYYMDLNWRSMSSERAIVYVKLDPEKWTDFTLGNPAELGWEVVPFSFVLDWHLDVGGYLSSLDALKGVSFSTGTVSRKWDYQISTRDAINGFRLIDKYKDHRKHHERIAVGAIPMPSFPSWEPSGSWRRLMHGVSLLTAINKRCRK